jgi:hypothetical protein
MLFMKTVATLFLAITTTFVISDATVIAAEASPLQISGSYRLRAEVLDNPYRANTSGSDQILASRLLLSARWSGDNLFSELEIQDSRTWLDDAGTPLGTDDVNTLEPLQAYVGWRQSDRENHSFALKAGRMTLDIGSRRLIGRNGFRNTSNAFTGLHGDWRADNWRLQPLYLLPLHRQPTARKELDANKHAWDREYSGIRLWGLHGTRSGQAGLPNVEGYFFTLDEEDSRHQASSNRNIDTLGVRVFKPAAQGQWDYEWEGAVQRGQSRSSAAATDMRDLDHRAAFMHAQVGYQFRDEWSSRLILLIDYASGDETPTDSENNRFDTLYGPRRGDFGPTSIYGAFGRSNILSPGATWEFQRRGYTGAIAYRAVWLADKRDAFTTGGLRDVTGATDDFLGQQLEARLRFNVFTNTQIELGSAYLHKGDFLQNAPNAPANGNTLYWYSHMMYQF